jgi:hypothetical protein
MVVVKATSEVYACAYLQSFARQQHIGGGVVHRGVRCTVPVSHGVRSRPCPCPSLWRVVARGTGGRRTILRPAEHAVAFLLLLGRGEEWAGASVGACGGCEAVRVGCVGLGLGGAAACLAGASRGRGCAVHVVGAGGPLLRLQHLARLLPADPGAVDR